MMIALTTVQYYGIYCPGGRFDLRHRWTTNIIMEQQLHVVNHVRCLSRLHIISMPCVNLNSVILYHCIFQL